jgi:hypothetical protein
MLMAISCKQRYALRNPWHAPDKARNRSYAENAAKRKHQSSIGCRWLSMLTSIKSLHLAERPLQKS